MPRTLALAVVIVLLAGCGGRTAAVVPHPAAAPTSGPSATSRDGATVVITIPKKSSLPSAGSRRPAYLSPATNSISFVVTKQGQSPMAPINANLTSTSSGCTSSLVATTCTVALPLGPGTYTMTATTYDGVLDNNGNPTGSQLSTNQNVPQFTIVAGQANTISVSLGGIPHAILVVPAGGEKNALGDQDRGFALIGTAAVSFTVIATDADGNFIIGPGAPVFGVASNASSVGVSTSPSSSKPNAFALLAPAFSMTQSTITVTVSNAAAFGLTCGSGGVICTKTVAVDAGAIVVQVSGGVVIFSASGAGPFAQFTNAYTHALDQANALYIGGGTQILKYLPPYSTVAATVETGSYTYALRTDDGSNVYQLTSPSGACAFRRFTPSLAVVSTTNCASGETAYGELTLAVTGDGNAVGIAASYFNYTDRVLTFTSADNGQSYSRHDLYDYNAQSFGNNGFPVGYPAAARGARGELLFAFNSTNYNGNQNYQQFFSISPSPYTSQSAYFSPITNTAFGQPSIASDPGGNVFLSTQSLPLNEYTPPSYSTANPVNTTAAATGLSWVSGIGLFEGHYSSVGLRSADETNESTVVSNPALSNTYVSRISVIP